ncbi:transcriptional regulator with XRE-family HTH domain [Streptomonospora nanhaiensis]|uniref:Transcriptional regulator with XRE-family HTH domain n=1 Tax=Streptomonospora nanhaiensis TaxID=1323731 RepID=A0A853BQV5_9ACTN|nr:transcriptional regulator with XRE-family HTH domain [Streptomonospora nanhaiensis]
MNEALRRALANARLTDTDAAERLGVDPKTVRRWLSGQTPYARHRWAMADLVGIPEHELWPTAAVRREESQPFPADDPKVYPHRWAVPHAVWRQLFESAHHEIGVLVYSGLFLAEDTGILHLFEEKAHAEVRVRILLGDPGSPHVQDRGDEEGIGSAMAAKVRNALVLYKPLMSIDGIEIRQHGTVLYNSVFRADNRMLINQHIYGAPASATPVLVIDGDTEPELFATYINSFEHTWNGAVGVEF